MTSDEIEFRCDVLLTFQVALLGMVVPSLRGVTVGWDEDSITGICFYDCDITDEEVEVASQIETEIYASFPDHEVSVTAVKYPMPNNLEIKVLEAWAYCRNEYGPWTQSRD
ncbi:MAG: hypothetical protein GY839_12515 [candidate division Zixibacteria bacterium]|nr:hypothetical protein [candidate division Zixibacteria bacterium]